MTKKVLALLLALVMTLSLCPLTAFADDVTESLAEPSPIMIEEKVEGEPQENGEDDKGLGDADEKETDSLELAQVNAFEAGEPVIVYTSTKIVQKTLFAAIASKVGDGGKSTLYVITDGDWSRTSVGKNSGSNATLKDGAIYTVYDSNRNGNKLGSFVFYEVPSLKNGTLNYNDRSKEKVLSAVLADSMAGKLDALGLTAAALDVKYQAKSGQFADLGYTPDTGAGEHAFGAQGSETVQVSLTYDGTTFTKTATLTVERTPEIAFADPNVTAVAMREADDYAADVQAALILKDPVTLEKIADGSVLSADVSGVRLGSGELPVSYAGGKINGISYAAVTESVAYTLVEAPHYAVTLNRAGTDLTGGSVSINDRAIADGESRLFHAEENSITVTATAQDGGSFVVSVVLTDGASVIQPEKQGDTYTFTGLVEGAEYSLLVTMNLVNIVLRGNVTISDTSDLKKSIYNAVVDVAASTVPEGFGIDSVDFEYVALDLVTKTWAKLNNTDTSWGKHKFNTTPGGDSETVRLLYMGNNNKQYGEDFTVLVTNFEITPNDELRYRYYDGMYEAENMGLNEIRLAAYNAIVKDSSVQLVDNDGILHPNATMKYNVIGYSLGRLDDILGLWQELDNDPSGISGYVTHRFGEADTELVRITYGGDGTYYPYSGDFKLKTYDDRTVPELTEKEGEHVYNFFPGKTASAQDIFDILVESSVPNMNPDGVLSDEVTVEYNAGNYSLDILHLADGWEKLDFQGGSGKHSFGQEKEQIRISFEGKGENKKSYQEKSWIYELNIEDQRDTTEIRCSAEEPITVFVGTDIAATLDAYFQVIDTADGSEEPVPGALLSYSPDTTTLEASEFEQEITVSYEGDFTHKGAESVTVKVLVTVPQNSYKVNIVVDPESTGTGSVRLIPAFVKDDEYNVEEHSGFTVISEPSKNNNWLDASKRYSDYTASIVVTDAEGTEILRSGKQVDRLEVAKELLTQDEVVSGECEFTVTVTFTRAALELKQGVELPYHMIRSEDGSFDPAFTQTVFDAVFDKENSRPSDLKLEDVTVQYYAGSSGPLGEADRKVLGLGWQSLDFDLNNMSSEFISSLGGLVMHSFGANGVDSTEDVRISYQLGGNTFYAETTVTLADLRQATVMSCGDVSSIYNRLRATILPLIEVNVLNDDGSKGEAVNFKSTDIEISDVNANLLQRQTVTVSFKGNREYKPCDCEVSAYVMYGVGTIFVSSKLLTYDPDRTRDDANEILNGMITVTPSDVDYITVINGLDAGIEGFVSIDLPQSLRDRMNFNLLDNDILNRLLPEGSTIDELRQQLAGFTGIDFYEILSNAVKDGVPLKSLSNTLLDLANQMNTKVPGLDKTYAELMNFNTESFNTLIGVLELIPSIGTTRITLGNAPRDAGLYAVNAISTDFNYLPALGVGALTILPLSRDVKLAFDERSPLLEKKTVTTLLLKIPVSTVYEVSYADFRSAKFDAECGAIVTCNSVVVKDPEFVISYTGLADDLDPTILDMKGKPVKSGTYLQTISLIGNYQALPITRTIKVLPGEAVIEAEDQQTFAYDGNAHAVKYNAYLKSEDAPAIPPEDMTVTYKQKSTGILGGLKNLVTKGSTTAPTEAGTYEVTISYNGESAVKKIVTLTIEAAAQVQSAAKTTKSSGLSKLFR